MEIQGQRLHPIERLCLWMFIFSFCFDFRGNDAGGSAAQYVFALVSGVTTISLIVMLLRRKFVPASRDLKRMTIFWWVYLTSTVIFMIVHLLTNDSNVTLERYIRIALPYFLCGLSLLNIYVLQKANIHPSEVLLPSICCTIISSFWHFYYAIKIADLDINRIRYQMLSPMAPFEFAYGFVGIFLLQRLRFLSVLALIVSTASIVVSATRTYIFTVLACVIGLIFLQRYNPIKMSPRAVVRGTLSAGAIVLIAISVFVIIITTRPEIVTVWQSRFLAESSGTEDVTLLTRISEARGAWHALTEDPIYLLFGKGMGAAYYWDRTYRLQISAHGVFPDEPTWGGTDSEWPWALFISGFLFSPMVLGLYLFSLHKSWQLAKLYVHFPKPSDKTLIVVPFFVCVAYFSQSFTSMPLGDRSSAQNFGLAIGLAYWIYYLCRNAQKIQMKAEQRMALEMSGLAQPQ